MSILNRVLRNWKKPLWLDTSSITALTVAIFITDVLTDWAIAVAVLYVVPILLSLRTAPRRRVIWLAAMCCMLTVLGSPLGRYGPVQAGMVNVGISLTAILTTTHLGLKMLASEIDFYEARAHLIRLSRISNLGDLAASIAHEVNQPLAVLSSSAAACRRWLNADPPDLTHARRSLDRIVVEATRAADVLNGVRRLAAGRQTSSSWTDIGDVVIHSVNVARAEISRNGIALTLELSDGLPQLHIDRIQIQQVMINLLLNAIESLAQSTPVGGEISIVCHCHGGSISVEVTDNGAGLSRAAQRHLWEPFWTEREGGTGLGLTMSRAIAEAHRGTLDWRSNDAGGAVFILKLPIGDGRGHA